MKGRLPIVILGVVLAIALGLGGCVSVVTEVVDGGLGGTGSGGGAGASSSGGVPAVPPSWESIEEAAAAGCPGMPWSLLGAIGRVESDSGQSTLPGVDSGANSAGAEGPMQFEPATFAEFAQVGPGGAEPPSPYDPVDAIYTAAHMLCVDGAGNPNGVPGAVWDYNHSSVYVDTVVVLAQSLFDDPDLDSVPASAVGYAAAQLGTPYQWGGSGPGGFDCSGLVQAAYRSAGVTLPRVAQDQFDAGPAVPPTAGLEPGDLVFFGQGPASVDHVGLVIGGGDMIDAPHSGAVVRVEPYDWTDRVGATRPG